MPVTPEDANRLSMQLIRLMKLLRSLHAQAPRLHPAVETAAYPILFNLLAGPKRVSSLAECVHSDVSTVSRQASHLTSHGLLEKLQDPQDGRALMLSLTPAGKQLLDELVQQRGDWFRHLLRDWDVSDIEQFSRSLARLSAECERERERLTNPDTTKEPRP
jgi:DNA-binding MarR family transcriptional regulator